MASLIMTSTLLVTTTHVNYIDLPKYEFIAFIVVRTPGPLETTHEMTQIHHILGKVGVFFQIKFFFSSQYSPWAMTHAHADNLWPRPICRTFIWPGGIHGATFEH